MSPRAARRGGRAERKSPGPNTTLSLWGEPGQPEGYDPGAPTGPLELAELAEVHEQVEAARDETGGPVQPIEATEGTEPVDQGLDAEHAGESQAARSAQPDVQGGTIAETAEKIEYPREVVPPAELVITMSSGDGTELPHWADPPTGEVPRAVSGSKAQEDELQAWRLLGSRGLHWRDDVNDWSDGPGMEDLVDNDEIGRASCRERVYLEV